MQRRATLLSTALLAFAALAGCDNAPTAPRIPAQLDVVSGNDQQGVAGQELPHPLVVKVVDEEGRPVRDQVVSFRVVSGGGSVSANSSVTNRAGVAHERWTLGPVAADSQRIEAHAVDSETGQDIAFAVFRATARAGAPAHLSPVGATTRVGDAGAAVADSLVVRVTDITGNPVGGTPVTWTVVTGGGALFPRTTDANGIAKARWTLGPRVDSAHMARASVDGVAAVEFTGTASLPPDATLELVSGNHQTTVAGTTLPAPLVVRARLRDARPVRGVSILWQGAVGSTFTPVLGMTDANGLASTSWTLPNLIGAMGAWGGVNDRLPRAVGFHAEGTPPATRLTTISTGSRYACGVAQDGSTYCWGGGRQLRRRPPTH